MPLAAVAGDAPVRVRVAAWLGLGLVWVWVWVWVRLRLRVSDARVLCGVGVRGAPRAVGVGAGALVRLVLEPLCRDAPDVWEPARVLDVVQQDGDVVGRLVQVRVRARARARARIRVRRCWAPCTGQIMVRVRDRVRIRVRVVRRLVQPVAAAALRAVSVGRETRHEGVGDVEGLLRVGLGLGLGLGLG